MRAGWPPGALACSRVAGAIESLGLATMTRHSVQKLRWHAFVLAISGRLYCCTGNVDWRKANSHISAADYIGNDTDSQLIKVK
jgi:hypothetical protein